MSKQPMHGSCLQQHPLLYPLTPVSSQYPCSQRAETTQLSWRTPFFRVGNGSAFAVCTCLVWQSPCPWRQSAGSIASQIINSNNLRIEVPRSFLPQPTGNPHISSVITIYSFAPQQHPADSVMSLNPAMIGALQKTAATQSLPHRADALRHEREALPASLPRHTLTTVPAPYTEFSSQSTRTKRQ